jgi:hypothetical protein
LTTKTEGKNVATPEHSAQQILMIFVASGARPGGTFPISIGNSFEAARFPGAVQKEFLRRSATLSDLSEGLARCLAQGWLSVGRTFGEGSSSAMQTYVLEQGGFVQGGGN